MSFFVRTQDGVDYVAVLLGNIGVPLEYTGNFILRDVGNKKLNVETEIF